MAQLKLKIGEGKTVEVDIDSITHIEPGWDNEHTRVMADGIVWHAEISLERLAKLLDKRPGERTPGAVKSPASRTEPVPGRQRAARLP